MGFTLLFVLWAWYKLPFIPDDLFNDVYIANSLKKKCPLECRSSTFTAHYRKSEVLSSGFHPCNAPPHCLSTQYLEPKHITPLGFRGTRNWCKHAEASTACWATNNSLLQHLRDRQASVLTDRRGEGSEPSQTSMPPSQKWFTIIFQHSWSFLTSLPKQCGYRYCWL